MSKRDLSEFEGFALRIAKTQGNRTTARVLCDVAYCDQEAVWVHVEGSVFLADSKQVDLRWSSKCEDHRHWGTSK